MQIRILCVGSLNEPYLKKACHALLQELRKYADVTIEEVADERTAEDAGEREIALVQEKEAQRLLSKIQPNQLVFCFDLDAPELTSGALRSFLASQKSSHRAICFLIGGSLGLSPSLLARADIKRKISDFTFPHALFRLILLEELCHAFK